MLFILIILFQDTLHTLTLFFSLRDTKKYPQTIPIQCLDKIYISPVRKKYFKFVLWLVTGLPTVP